MTFGITITFLPITASLFGGRGTLSGPLVGTVLIMAIQEILWANNILLSLLIYGVILMFSGIFIPEGLVRNPWIVSRLKSMAYLLKHKVA
jgi:branched-chain amino acid transport system permease protein